MFRAEPWVEAFLAAAKAGEGEPFPGPFAETALEYLKVFCRAALALPGDLSGKSDADRLGVSIQRALERGGDESGAAELARRFILLLIGKNSFHGYNRIIVEIEKRLNRARGIEEAIVEAAAMPDKELLELAGKKCRDMTGAREVKTTVRVIPDLIGGVRLRIGSILFDGSVKTRLKKMAEDLSNGIPFAEAQ